ncbi:MAG: histidine phosphatase family protein [Acidimicrobiia bacterium]
MPVPRLVLVRHGHPAAGYLEDLDPPLDDEGHAQAERMAEELSASGSRALVTSPRRRAAETAAALEAAWGRRALVEARVAEIPAPTDDLVDRGAWLRSVMRSTWSAVGDPALHAWRDGVRAALGELAEDTVVVTHYLVLNAAVGLATADDRVVLFRPDHCSRTVLDVTPSGLALVEFGAQRETRVV